MKKRKAPNNGCFFIYKSLIIIKQNLTKILYNNHLGLYQIGLDQARSCKVIATLSL